MTIPKSNLKKDIEDALDWQLRATIEAMFEAEKTGKPIKVHVTQELIDKHKSKATTQIINLIESVIPEEKLLKGFKQYVIDHELAHTYDGEQVYSLVHFINNHVDQYLADIKSKLIGEE